MRIGGNEFCSNVFLCPLAGFTDLAFRLIVRSLGGLALAYTELVHPRGLREQNKRSMQLVQTNESDRPLAMQLYGTDAQELADAAKWAADQGATLVDINMGCPVAKVAGKGGGSGILRRCDDAVRLAATIVDACPISVTVKTRLGWEDGNLVAPQLARQFEEIGVAALTIHGRYGEQKFKGEADWNSIAAVVDAVQSIPVIGNGDIKSPGDAKRLIDTSGCAGVMIGRAALVDPWIISSTHTYLNTGTIPQPPSRIQRTQLMIEHFEQMRQTVGDHLAILGFRKRIGWYRKAIGPCPKLRRQMPTMKTIDEFYSLVGEFLDELSLGAPSDEWRSEWEPSGQKESCPALARGA